MTITKMKRAMSKYFKLEEFLSSTVARKKQIPNLPSWDVIEHLKELADVLDDIREAWGSSINVTSGFRCKALNKAVGGVKTSLHIKGWAADLVPGNGSFDAFVDFLKEWGKTHQNFDKIIIEKSKSSGGRWIHFAVRGNQGEQRRKIFSLDAD